MWLGPVRPTNSTFCCGELYNVTSQQCGLATQGSTQPFELPNGFVMFDRINGTSVDPAAYGNGSGTFRFPGVTTVSSSSCPSDSGRVVAVGAGVGASLGVAFLVSLAFAWQQWRLRRRAEKQLQQHQLGFGDGSEKHGQQPTQLAPMDQAPSQQQPHLTAYQPTPQEVSDEHRVAELANSDLPGLQGHRDR